MPLAKTPMSESGASELRRHADKLSRSIEAIAPWLTIKGRRRRKGDPVGSGEVEVILDSWDSPKNPLYEGAKISRQE